MLLGKTAKGESVSLLIEVVLGEGLTALGEKEPMKLKKAEFNFAWTPATSGALLDLPYSLDLKFDLLTNLLWFFIFLLQNPLTLM